MRPDESIAFAPMKTNYFNIALSHLRHRGVAAFLCGVCALSAAGLNVQSQVKQKHLTAMQLGDASEGARVTVVSDASLGDYEAYRSGNRFYVKIPVADLNFVPPRLRADGFDDVQVQRSGDGVLISFKLQPGATARVEMRGNRLEVVFSAPNRMARNRSGQTDGSSSTVGTTASAARDIAGPSPAPNTSRERFATPVTEENSFPAVANSRRTRSRQRNTMKGQQSTGTSAASDHPPASISAVPSPSASPFVAPTPYNGSYTPLNTATPASVVGTNTSSGSNNNVAAGSQWRGRAFAALAWMKANRLATLVAALILLSLIVYLLAALRGRRTDATRMKQAKTAKVQPKLSADELNERPRQETPPPAPLRTETPNRQPATAAAAATSSGHSISGSTHEPQSSEEQEREVFEL